jgi:hypothetical protein
LDLINYWKPFERWFPTAFEPGVLIILLSFLAGGCSTVPSRTPNVSAGGAAVPTPDRAVKMPVVLPVPIRTFQPVKPSMVRLPIDVTFPQGGGAFQKISNLVKDGITQAAQGPVLGSRMGALWSKMESPIRLDKNIWLLIRPASLSVGMMRTDLKRASTLHAVVEMTASPEVLFGAIPLVTHVKMPPLQPFQPGPGIFQAMANTHINFEDANRYFRDPRMGIIGKVLPGSGERKLTIEGIRVYGSGGKVSVEVKLLYNPLILNLSDKPAKLTLYLSGTPRYLPKKRVFDLPDLDYDIKSSDLMLQVADFILKGDFRNQLRGIAIVPAGLKMDILKAKITKKLNRALGRYAHVRTQVNSFEVLDGFADNEGFEARVTFKGTATLEVIWR